MIQLLSGRTLSKLKTMAIEGEPNLSDGLYVHAGRPRFVDLLRTDLDASDYFVPNGHFNGSTFELHSLISDERKRGDATPYLAPAGERPSSETEGTGALDVVGQAFTNLPEPPASYVQRPILEKDVRDAITDDRHPIVTLVGRGGIGKTSLALTVLHEAIKSDRFLAVIWFSARDIDLTTAGAKLVRPKVLTEKDIASEYKRLIGAQSESAGENVTSVDLMARHLRSAPFSPMLFVFDNFETVQSPVDLYNWIDLNIRLPNKVLITSRFRDFRADFPIEISGMEPDEAGRLVDRTADRLAIRHLIGRAQREELVEDLDGHPYVIKIVLGEIANAKRYSKPERIVARQKDILSALFERTYASLSPTASRIFLTLSLWRSLVPQLAVEAMLLRHKVEQTDPNAAIEQLVRSSLIERITADDGLDFLEVPLTAALFGRRKAEVSPIRQIIDTDVLFLQDIGPTAASGLRQSMAPKVEAFFRRTAQRIVAGAVQLSDMREVLEFFANGFPPAWLHLSTLEEEQGEADRLDRAAGCVRRFLATNPEPKMARLAWLRVSRLYELKRDVIGGCGAFLRAAELAAPSFAEISHMANLINNSNEVKAYDFDQRATFYRPIAAMMEKYIDEASATDLSRLAWVYLHMGDKERAVSVAEQGLRLNPTNVHCRRLVTKLTSDHEYIS